MSTQNLDAMKSRNKKHIYLYSFFPSPFLQTPRTSGTKWRYWTIEVYFGGGFNPLHKPYPYSFFLGEDISIFLGTWNIRWIQTIRTKTELQNGLPPPWRVFIPPPLLLVIVRYKTLTSTNSGATALLLRNPGSSPKKWDPIFFRGDYKPGRLTAGTWEYTPGKGKSSSKPSFSGSMLIFRGVQLMFFLLAVMKHLWCMQFVTPCWWLSCWCFFGGFQGFLGQTLWKVKWNGLKCHLKVHQKLARKRGRQLRLEKELKNSWPRPGPFGSQMQALVGWVFFHKITRTFQYLSAKLKFVLSQKIRAIFCTPFIYQDSPHRHTQLTGSKTDLYLCFSTTKW